MSNIFTYFNIKKRILIFGGALPAEQNNIFEYS